jgi:hypothetical protein
MSDESHKESKEDNKSKEDDLGTDPEPVGIPA